VDSSLPSAGAANPEVARLAHDAWIEAATKAGFDLTGFDPDAPLDQRLAWAERHDLDIGAVLSRFSSKLQHSTLAQVRDNVQAAARGHIYVPPEFVCIDEAVSGRKARRDGLDRMRLILKHRLARVLLVFKVSRLFRVAYLGFKFFQEDVVEEGLRAISISQGIDTADEKAWKPLAYLHGVMDEMLLGSIADHVRSGIKDLFLQGYVTGALPVGYRAVEVPGAPPTNRGRPRTMPRVAEGVDDRIRQHFRWIRDGMPIKEGWRRWVTDGGPCDPRSTSGHMTYAAYRRMLSNPRYTGRWAFGQKRNVWSSKRDYTRQMPQPDADVALVQCDELRLVDDALFFAVQQRLAELKLGPRGPKKQKPVQLWDLVTDCFHCARCRVRFYQAGANGRGMTCKRGDLCPSRSSVRRDEAVRAVCGTLADQLRQDDDLIAKVLGRARQLDVAGDEAVQAELARVEQAIVTQTHKIEDLTELAGQGSDQDRATLKAKIRAAQVERAARQAERARLRQALEADEVPLTPERVREVLGDLTQLLEDGAAGVLGTDVVYRAAATFRQLVGSRVWVHVDRRAGRQRTNVRGTFRPDLIRTARSGLGLGASAETPEPPEVQVWLRQPPKKDQLAERVHQLMDIESLSYREAAAALQAEGHRINSGVVWQIYHRYYELIGQPVPERPYNNGRPRKRARRTFP
jgi:site-specific DNA recombinase